MVARAPGRRISEYGRGISGRVERDDSMIRSEGKGKRTGRREKLKLKGKSGHPSP